MSWKMVVDDLYSVTIGDTKIYVHRPDAKSRWRVTISGQPVKGKHLDLKDAKLAAIQEFRNLLIQMKTDADRLELETKEGK